MDASGAIKKSGLGRKLSITSISLVVMTHNAVAAIMSEMKTTFSAIDPTTVQSFLTIATFSIMVGTLISGIISGFIGKRRLLLIGMAIFTIGGVAPFFLQSFPLMMASRIILGLGSGLVNPIAASLIADFYEGDERAQLMGLKSMAGGMGQTVTTFLAGLLASFGWRYSFWVYLIGVVIFAICYFTIPEPPAIKSATGEKLKTADNYKISGGVIIVSLGIALYMMLYLVILSNFAIILKESELGGPGTAGSLISTMTLTSMFTSMIFGALYKRLRFLVPIIGLTCFTVGLFALSRLTSIPIITVMMVALGVGNGCCIPFFYDRLAVYSPRTSMNFCMSIMIVGVNVGSFVSPYVMTAVATALGANTGRFKYEIAAVLYAVLLASVIFYAIRSRKKSENSPA